jgi:hypothetical protein
LGATIPALAVREKSLRSVAGSRSSPMNTLKFGKLTAEIAEDEEKEGNGFSLPSAVHSPKSKY